MILACKQFAITAVSLILTIWSLVIFEIADLLHMEKRTFITFIMCNERSSVRMKGEVQKMVLSNVQF